MRPTFALLVPSGVPHAPNVVRVAAGQRVYQTHGLAGCCYLVQSGLVRLEKYSEQGERCIVLLLGPGAALGLDALQQVLRQTDAWACTDVVLHSIPILRRPGQTTVPDTHHTELYAGLLRQFHDAMAWTAQLTRGTARQRVVSLLLRIAALTPSAQPIWLPSRQDMADMVGITHVTASRIVAQLCREGALTRQGPSTAWVDTEQLRG